MFSNRYRLLTKETRLRRERSAGFKLHPRVVETLIFHGRRPEMTARRARPLFMTSVLLTKRPTLSCHSRLWRRQFRVQRKTWPSAFRIVLSPEGGRPGFALYPKLPA